MKTETIIWCELPADRLPDDDITVLAGADMPVGGRSELDVGPPVTRGNDFARA